MMLRELFLSLGYQSGLDELKVNSQLSLVSFLQRWKYCRHYCYRVNVAILVSEDDQD